jgi:hypothetical protein
VGVSFGLPVIKMGDKETTDEERHQVSILMKLTTAFYKKLIFKETHYLLRYKKLDKIEKI